jgi:ubiquinone/menaquinone biosynthesis C-methylase UbiE
VNRMSEKQGPGVQDYSALAGDYDRTRYVGDANTLKENFRVETLRSLLPEGAGRALDVACGTGRGVLLLRDITPIVFGVDGTAEMLAAAAAKLGDDRRTVCLARGNAASLPFADATFDVVISLNFVHLFDVPAKRTFIREMARVTRPGGVVIVEFDNAFQGLVLGGIRKYFGKDIGYDWPWQVRASFPRDLVRIEMVAGSNLPGVWRVPSLHFTERMAKSFPVNYLASRVFVRARRY